MITRRLYAFTIWSTFNRHMENFMSRKVIDARADMQGQHHHVKIEGNRRRESPMHSLRKKLAQIGVTENERNLNNKISRAAFYGCVLAPMLKRNRHYILAGLGPAFFFQLILGVGFQR